MDFCILKNKVNNKYSIRYREDNGVLYYFLKRYKYVEEELLYSVYEFDTEEEALTMCNNTDIVEEIIRKNNESWEIVGIHSKYL